MGEPSEGSERQKSQQQPEEPDILFDMLVTDQQGRVATDAGMIQNVDVDFREQRVPADHRVLRFWELSRRRCAVVMSCAVVPI
jgi:hypothetical protein